MDVLKHACRCVIHQSYFFTSRDPEYTYDIGYSCSMEPTYQMSGESNAIEGYIIFEGPESPTPDKT